MRKKVKKKVSRSVIPIGLPILFVLMMACGCAPPRQIHANYILPPRQAIGLPGKTTFQLPEPDLHVTGDALTPSVTSVLGGYLKDRFTALIYQENAHQVADEFCQSPKGLADLQRRIGNHHGYSNVHCPPNDPVLVYMEGHVDIQRGKGLDQIEKQLVTVPYRSVKIPQTDGTEKIESKQLQPIYRRHVDKIPFETLMATGDLHLTLKDKRGNILYSNGFQGLKYGVKVGGDSQPGALPTPVEIAARLFNAPLVEVVKDLSPHSETRSLVVNEKGDPMAVALMRATAFSEAMERLDNILTEQEKKYEELKKQRESELNKKIEEINSSSKAPDVKTAEIEKAKNACQEELQKAMSPSSPDFHNAAIGCEVTGDWDLALFYYKMAYDADSSNTEAKASLDRLNGEIDKIKRQQKDAQGKS